MSIASSSNFLKIILYFVIASRSLILRSIFYISNFDKLLIYYCYFSLFLSFVLICIHLTEINGFAEDLYGDVTPVEIISSIGSLWNFGPGHQDVHELFHVVLSALDAEMQPANRVCD